METKVVNGLLILKLNMIQTVALAIIVYYLGATIRRRIPLLMRFSFLLLLSAACSLPVWPLSCGPRVYWDLSLTAPCKRLS